MALIYMVHDLDDPAVARRLRMLSMGGIVPVLLGFRRGPQPIRSIEGVACVDLGRTEDARLLARAGSVLRQALMLGRLRPHFEGARVILARNLEMLVLAHLAKARFAPAAKVVFECLDVHATLVARGPKGRAMRLIERRLLARSAGLVVSSQAFVTHHFAALGLKLPPVRLVENKVLEAEGSPNTLKPALPVTSQPALPVTSQPALPVTLQPALPVGPPWRIGWFGVLRCRRSLAMLADLVRRFPGRVEVDLRGRPSRSALPEFDAVVASHPGLVFHGPYDRARDLAAIYAAVHFAWTPDYYEEGANSDWLLPNRLYESGAHHTVALAQEASETGRWLAARGQGVVLASPLERSLPAFMESLTASRFAGLRMTAGTARMSDFVCGTEEARNFVAWLNA